MKVALRPDRIFSYFDRLRKCARPFARFASSLSVEDLDRIDLKELRLFGYHGVLPEEKRNGQNFIVDASLFLSLRASGLTDDLRNSVNYASVYEDIEQVMRGPSLNLIEHLAETMCQRILEEYPPVKKVQVSIRKPEAPLPCPKDSFSSVGQSSSGNNTSLLACVEAVRCDFVPPKKRLQQTF